MWNAKCGEVIDKCDFESYVHWSSSCRAVSKTFLFSSIRKTYKRALSLALDYILIVTVKRKNVKLNNSKCWRHVNIWLRSTCLLLSPQFFAQMWESFQFWLKNIQRRSREKVSLFPLWQTKLCDFPFFFYSFLLFWDTEKHSFLQSTLCITIDVLSDDEARNFTLNFIF